MDCREPPEQKQTRYFSLAEREDSKQERHRPSEVNGVLTKARVCRGNEIAAWTEYQQAKHEGTLEELRNMDKFDVVKVDDSPQTGQVLSTPCVHKQRLGGTWRCELWQEVLNKRSV